MSLYNRCVNIPVLVLLLSLQTAVVFASTPSEIVKSTTQEMLAALKKDKAVINKDPSRIYDLVDEIVLPKFDFETMAQSVLGKYWRRASKEQKQKFVEEFRILLVRTYAGSLSEYTDQEVVFLPERPSSDKTSVLVRTEIQQSGGFPIPVDYELVQHDKDWKVSGVVIDGLNLVTNYRTTFAKEIREIGLQGTIDKLAQRNKEVQSVKEVSQ